MGFYLVSGGQGFGQEAEIPLSRCGGRLCGLFAACCDQLTNSVTLAPGRPASARWLGACLLLGQSLGRSPPAPGGFDLVTCAWAWRGCFIMLLIRRAGWLTACSESFIYRVVDDEVFTPLGVETKKPTFTEFTGKPATPLMAGVSEVAPRSAGRPRSRGRPSVDAGPCCCCFTTCRRR